MSLKEKLFSPVWSTIIFVLVITILFALLDEENAFKNFLHFGPSKDIKFLTFTMNTWPKVILLYLISFIVAILRDYFNLINTKGFITSTLLNKKVTEVELSRKESEFVIYLYPICIWALNIIVFFVTLTRTLQFLLPYLLGSLTINYPYLFSALDKKKIKS